MMEGSPAAEMSTPGRRRRAARRPRAGGAPHGAPHPAIELSRRARFEVLGAILLALLLGALDQTIVGTALPTIVTDLQGNDLYTWVVTIYLLTSTITVPFYGKLSDIFGRKPLLLFGITTFLVGSALSGLSQTMEQLILFRGIQGIGAGALFPISLAVIGDLFTPAERGKYQGLFGAVFGLSALVGPALGGFITDNISWHWIFFVNLPIGIVSLAVVGPGAALDPTAARQDEPRLRRRRDLRGRDDPAPHRPDQQAVRRVDGPAGRRAASPSASRSWPSSSSSRAARRSRSSRSTCGATGPTRARWSPRSSPRSASSPRSSSCRATTRWCSARAPRPAATP